jgi:hypothetical protein
VASVDPMEGGVLRLSFLHRGIQSRYSPEQLRAWTDEMAAFWEGDAGPYYSRFKLASARYDFDGAGDRPDVLICWHHDEFNALLDLRRDPYWLMIDENDVPGAVVPVFPERPRPQDVTVYRLWEWYRNELVTEGAIDENAPFAELPDTSEPPPPVDDGTWHEGDGEAWKNA